MENYTRFRGIEAKDTWSLAENPCDVLRLQKGKYRKILRNKTKARGCRYTVFGLWAPDHGSNLN